MSDSQQYKSSQKRQKNDCSHQKFRVLALNSDVCICFPLTKKKSHCFSSIKKHLEPLACVSCILQATRAHLDQVPIVFGTLIKEVQKMIHDDSINSWPVEIMIDSIKHRWVACDQDVCIAAIILHPRPLPSQKFRPLYQQTC